jgi:O-antigen/teichoic acid export membrane protein
MKLWNQKLLRQMLSNSSWLFLENAARMVIGFTVGVWLTRYLGPEKFGVLSYSSTLIGIFSILAKLGLDAVVIRELVESPKNEGKIIFSALVLNFIGAFISFILFALSAFILARNDFDLIFVCIILSFGLFFQPFQSIILWFRSRLLGKFIFLSKTATLITSSLLTIVLILNQANLFQIAMIRALELPILSIFLLFFYHKISCKIHKWRFNGAIAKSLLSNSWPLIFSSILVILNMHIDKIMLGKIIDNVAVGFYSAAVRLTELCYVIPIIIGTTVTPVLVQLRKSNENEYYLRLKQIFTTFSWISIAICVIVTLFSDFIISALYGPAYSISSSILSVHIWSSIFVFHVSMRSQAFIIEMKTHYITIFAIATTFLNILFNFVLIPKYFGVGAAFASLLSWSLGVLLVPLFWKPSIKCPLVFLQSIVFIPNKPISLS